jgi:hypothetical protein
MRNGVWMLVVAALVLLVLAGCGNVYLTGDAASCAENSALDAAGFAWRVREDPNASRLVRAYAEENAEQWRWFVRAARKDRTWGPKLPGDPNQ